MYMHCPSGDFLTFVFKLNLNYMYVEFYVFIAVSAQQLVYYSWTWAPAGGRGLLAPPSPNLKNDVICCSPSKYPQNSLVPMLAVHTLKLSHKSRKNEIFLFAPAARIKVVDYFRCSCLCPSGQISKSAHARAVWCRHRLASRFVISWMFRNWAPNTALLFFFSYGALLVQLQNDHHSNSILANILFRNVEHHRSRGKIAKPTKQYTALTACKLNIVHRCCTSAGYKQHYWIIINHWQQN